jgi:Fic family protein
MTLDITQLIRESNLIEGYDDPAFDAQGMTAWKYLAKVDRLDHGHVMKVQKILTLKQTDLQPDWRGYYRKIDVWVGGRKGAHPDAVPALMADWIYLIPEREPVPHHIEFEKIHPFVDGNGRTGRMLMWWMQAQRGEPYSQLTAADRQSYYAWFR